MPTSLASIPSPGVNAVEIGPLTIHFYGILIATAVAVAVTIGRRRYIRFIGDVAMFDRVAFWTVLGGLVGARLGFVITHSGQFEARPIRVFYVWEGGLTLAGMLIGGALTALYLLDRYHGDGWAFLDALAVGLPVAQAIGRWGNYFNQELFGTPTDLPWGIEIDPENRPADYLDAETFHPTFIYEVLWNLLIVVPTILFLERRGRLSKGSAFCVYLILYGIGRFLTELLRTDTTFRILGLSRNAWGALGAIALGAILLRRRQRLGIPQISAEAQ